MCCYRSKFERALLTDEEDLESSHKHDLVDIPEDPRDLFSDDVACLLLPQTSEGPFFIDGQPERSNIVDGQGTAFLPLSHCK